MSKGPVKKERSGDSSPFSAGSTLFEKNTPTAARKRFGRRRSLMLGGLCVLLLAGAMFFLLRLPENTPEPPEDLSIRLYSVRGVQKIAINGENSYTLLAESGERESATLAVANWDESLPLDSDAVAAVFSSLQSITALRQMQGGNDNLSDYGLAAPKSSVIITHAYGETKLFFGNRSPDGAGYYLRVENKDGVYLAATSLYNSIFLSKTAMINRTVIDALLPENVGEAYFDAAGMINKYDKITLRGKNLTEPLVFTMTERGGNKLHRIASPRERYADENAALALLAPFSEGLVADSVLAVNPSAKELAAFGLADPIREVDYEIGGERYGIKIGKIESGYALMVDGRAVIYALPTDALAFVTLSQGDFYAKKLLIPPKSSMRKITLAFSGKTAALALTHTPGENGSFASTAARMNGAVLSDEQLEGYLAALDGLIMQGQEESAAQDELLAVLTIEYESGTPEIFEFYRVSDRRIAAYERDKGFVMTLSANTLERLIEAAKERM